MRIFVSEKMKEWVAAYIRAHRKEGTISIHVVYSKFNEDFRATFSTDPSAAIQLLIAEGFLKGNPAKGGFSIWLPEDEGKGQRLPFRSRTLKVNNTVVSANQNQSAPPTDQNGEFEMKKEKVIIEPHYSFEKVPHPETGEVDVLELIRHIVQHLAAKLPQKTEMDGGYAIVKLNMSVAIQECGLSAGDVVGLSQVMQGMALIKPYGKSRWGILQSKAAGYFVTVRSYEIARKKWVKHNERNVEISQLRRKLQKRSESGTKPTDDNVSVSFEDEAVEALAEAEQLAEKLTCAQARIAELEAELAKRPTSLDAAKQALQDRLAAVKKASIPE